MQATLYLRKVRDFGEKVSDSLFFLKQNWKRLLTIYFIFIVPFLLIASIAGYFFAKHIVSIIQQSAESVTASDVLNPEFFIMVACIMIAVTGYSTAIYSYIRLYDENNNYQASLQEVARVAFKKFLPVFWRMMVVSVAMVIAFLVPLLLVVIAPVITVFAILFEALFIMIAVMYINAIFVLEDGSLSYATSRLFYLLKDKWWATIGYSLIIFLIYYFFAMILQFVAMMIMGAASLSILTPNLDQSPVGAGRMAGAFVAVIGIMVLLQQIFYTIVYCGIAVNYYSLAEEKDGSSIEQQINDIGSVTDKYGGVEETY
jgi:hypothetical protein